MEAFTKTCQCLNCEHCFTKNPLFSLLKQEELEILNSSRVEVSYRKGEIIYKQGMPLTHLVIIRSGIGKIYIEGSKGRNLILSYTRSFDMNGGIGVFIDQIHHSSLMAANDCETCFIDIKSFNQVMRANTEFMEGYLKYYSERVKHTYRQFAILTQKNMEGRMAESILYLKNKVFCNGSIKHVSKQDLSDFTAMSKESAIRVLKEFKDEGHIEFDKQDIIVTNEEALAKIAQLG